jgi:methylmalonyl-CoA/ethylmalonyl-CoA epimerase
MMLSPHCYTPRTRRRALPAGVSGCTVLALFCCGSFLHIRAAGVARDPTIYTHVSHLGWVVRDVDATVAAWRTLGVTDIHDAGDLVFQGVAYRGKTVTVRLKKAFARFKNASIEWIQPLNEGTAYADFLALHGEGVQHVAFSVPTDTRLTEELAQYRALGVGVLQGGTWAGRAGTGRFAHLDTAKEGGGMTLALEYDPDEARDPTPASANEDPFTRITQYAFVVRDVHKVSAFYERIGLGALPIERNISLDRVYRGSPGAFEMLLGWGRKTDLVFEWIQSMVGPNVYEEYLQQHSGGLHHLGFNVTDMDAAIAKLRSRGLGVTMSGGWNVNGYEGRFAYLDADKHGGVTIELLWNKPREEARLAACRSPPQMARKFPAVAEY